MAKSIMICSEMAFYYSILKSHRGQFITYSDIQIKDHIFPAFRKIKTVPLSWLLTRQTVFYIVT